MKYFISYAPTVQNTVRDMIESLRDSHDIVFWDQDVRAGQDWWASVLENIETCEVFLFMVSQDSVQSASCITQLRYALARNRLVLPYIVDAPLTYPLPDDITRNRLQCEIYDHNPAQFSHRVRITCRQIHWTQYQDRYAPRPPEPNSGTEDLIDLLDQAISLAYTGAFEDAISTFNAVLHNAYDEYGTFCNTWIVQMSHYRELAKMASRPAMRLLALPRWEMFLQTYGPSFDPLGVGDMLTRACADETHPSRPNSGLLAKTAPLSSIDSLPKTAPLHTSPNAPYALPARPAALFDVYAVIDTFHSACDEQDWERAAAILQDIRESGVRIPRVFNLDAHTREVQANLDAQERDKDYQLIRRMFSMKRPNYVRIHEALQDFWERYPGYDPAHLSDSNELLAQAWFNRAAALDESDYTGKLEAYSEAIALKVDFCEAYLYRGTVHHALKNYAQAVADFTKVILLDPTCVDAYYSRAYSYGAQHLRGLAAADFKMVLRLNPRHPHATRIRGLIESLADSARRMGRGA